MNQGSNSVLTLLGSSRSNGNTKLVADIIDKAITTTMVDLNHLDISYYDYEHKNRTDDFLPLIRDFVENHEVMLVVTPIYWYTMSAHIKVFLDRVSDLLTIEKDLGRKLRGKSMMLVSQTEGEDFAPWFADPIRMTAEYLGMNFIGHAHVSVEGETISTNSKKRLDQLFHSVK